MMCMPKCEDGTSVIKFCVTEQYKSPDFFLGRCQKDGGIFHVLEGYFLIISI